MHKTRCTMYQIWYEIVVRDRDRRCEMRCEQQREWVVGKTKCWNVSPKGQPTHRILRNETALLWESVCSLHLTSLTSHTHHIVDKRRDYARSCVSNILGCSAKSRLIARSCDSRKYLCFSKRHLYWQSPIYSNNPVVLSITSYNVSTAAIIVIIQWSWEKAARSHSNWDASAIARLDSIPLVYSIRVQIIGNARSRLSLIKLTKCCLLALAYSW